MLQKSEDLFLEDTSTLMNYMSTINTNDYGAICFHTSDKVILTITDNDEENEEDLVCVRVDVCPEQSNECKTTEYSEKLQDKPKSNVVLGLPEDPHKYSTYNEAKYWLGQWINNSYDIVKRKQLTDIYNRLTPSNADDIHAELCAWDKRRNEPSKDENGFVIGVAVPCIVAFVGAVIGVNIGRSVN
jgi:hypothetical protein